MKYYLFFPFGIMVLFVLSLGLSKCKPHTTVPTQTSHFHSFEDSIHFLRDFLVATSYQENYTMPKNKPPHPTVAYIDSVRNFHRMRTELKKIIFPVYDSVLIREAAQRVLKLALIDTNNPDYPKYFNTVSEMIKKIDIRYNVESLLNYLDGLEVEKVQLTPTDAFPVFKIAYVCRKFPFIVSECLAYNSPIFILYEPEKGFREIMFYHGFAMREKDMMVVNDTFINGYKPIIVRESLYPQTYNGLYAYKNEAYALMKDYCSFQYYEDKSKETTMEKIFKQNVSRSNKESFKKAWEHIPLDETW
ncbi:MAG: hypothetical protein R2798_03785 [Chitinophagales bacterium]|nr:hypothetical protein [Bacteroidota bacterium]MCB9043103.1 hypothetical protein [Chitinophagales bacterium]